MMSLLPWFVNPFNSGGWSGTGIINLFTKPDLVTWCAGLRKVHGRTRQQVQALLGGPVEIKAKPQVWNECVQEWGIPHLIVMEEANRWSCDICPTSVHHHVAHQNYQKLGGPTSHTGRSMAMLRPEATRQRATSRSTSRWGTSASAVAYDLIPVMRGGTWGDLKGKSWHQTDHKQPCHWSMAVGHLPRFREPKKSAN